MGCHQSPESQSDTLMRSSLKTCATTGVSSPCQLGSGGAGSIGTAGHGGSAESSGSAGASSADGGGRVGGTCKGGVSSGLAGGAPALMPGVWKDISPPGVPYGQNGTIALGVAVDPCNP